MARSHNRRRRYHSEDCRCNACLADAYGYDWRKLVPGVGWLRDYMNYALEVTDAPPIYHIASGIACLATVVGATCTFQVAAGDQHIPLNMWILAGGLSGKPRKSTAVNQVRKVLNRNFSYFMVPWSGSPEAIYSKIAQQPQCVMVIPEFPSFLAQLDQKYARSMKTTLMDLFDGESTDGRVTRGKGQERIENPRISLIGAAALDLLDRHLRDLDFRSGFLSRMFFVAGERKKWMRRPRSYPDDLLKLQDGLVRIAKWAAAQKVIRASQPADDALADLSKWVEDRSETVDGSYAPVLARNGTHAHKLAALYAASMQNPAVYSSLITSRVQPMIHHCVDVIEEYLVNMMSDSEFVRAAQRVKAWLRDSGYVQHAYIPFREIVRCSVDVKHAYAAVEQLEAEEILTRPLPSRHEGESRATSKVQLLKPVTEF